MSIQRRAMMLDMSRSMKRAIERLLLRAEKRLRHATG